MTRSFIAAPAFGASDESSAYPARPRRISPRGIAPQWRESPLKLLTDWCARFTALYPLWQHDLAVALVIMLVPPPVASWLVMRYADLEPYRHSAFGRYIARYMTHRMEAVRLGLSGDLTASSSASFRLPASR
jgi:hypothetical protein